MHSFHVPASAALTEMLRQDGELDRILDGQGLVFDNPPPPTLHQPAPFDIPAADWDQEERERAAAEQERDLQQRNKILAEELARLEDADSLRSLPAAPKKRRRRP